MALLSSQILDGSGGGEVQYYTQPVLRPYLPPPPPPDSGVTTGVNIPTGIAPVNNPQVIPFSPTETVTVSGGGGGLQIPAPVPVLTVTPQPSQPPTTGCSTCGPKTSQPPTSSAGGATSASTQQQQQAGGGLLAGLVGAGGENWGLLLLMLALGVALYEGVKERKRGGR